MGPSLGECQRTDNGVMQAMDGGIIDVDARHLGGLSRQAAPITVNLW